MHGITTLINIEVRQIGRLYGFGALMQQTTLMWDEFIKENNMPNGSQFVVGTCKAMTVDCNHNGGTGYECEWCCGCGWVTKKVSEVMEREDNEYNFRR